MRERTPSADDTPKRAPPAPSREIASADVAGNETSSDNTIEDYHTAKLSGISLALDTTLSSSSLPSTSDRMVASAQNLDDLGVNHSVSADNNGDHQLQERYGHAYKSTSQITQDKRSRLSNVINNLRKKVPDKNATSPRKEEDTRNSVERNLETLEKYVMTVLKGVIKEDERQEEEEENVEEDENTEKCQKNTNNEEEEEKEDEEEEEEDSTGMAIKSELSKESDIEAAVAPHLEDSVSISVDIKSVESSNITDCSNATTTVKENTIYSMNGLSWNSVKETSSRIEERLDTEEYERYSSDVSENNQEVLRERQMSRSLGTIIMNRLSEHQVEERANIDDGRGKEERERDLHDEQTEARAICGELLNDLLADVHYIINNQENRKPKTEECGVIDTIKSKVNEIKDLNAIQAIQELSVTSLHCSLPLDKVASVLQNCQGVSESAVALRLASTSSSDSTTTTQKLKSPTCITPPVRLLCLYCDRKFVSMSLRQRHTERVHQLGGGRRSERNSRKPSQNCQYCSEKCTDTLEALFQHMVGSHEDKYHACIQCLTRYPTREILIGHIGEMHCGNADKTRQNQSEKNKEGSPCKEFCSQNLREKMNASSVRDRKSEEKESKAQDDNRQSDNIRTKLIAIRDPIDNPASPEFDSSFYSNVSCNIRENLLHHLDGKLQPMSSLSMSSTCIPSIAITSTITSGTTTTATMTTVESKSQQQQQSQQLYYEHSVNQIQLPIDISLTAATPVYKDYSTSEEYENSSEYARKAGKTSSNSRPRRVSFEKYNFPRKYDGREQWTCSIKDLSKFDISTQLSLLKKQQLIKERLRNTSKLHQIPSLLFTTEVSSRDQEQIESIVKTVTCNQDGDGSNCIVNTSTISNIIHSDHDEPSAGHETTTQLSTTTTDSSNSMEPAISTKFSIEFADFMRLRWREQNSNEITNGQDVIRAELSGEWSRSRIYICGACGSKHVTLKEMEDHKTSMHSRVLCSHFELAGDQREYYQHLYLPGQCAATEEARDAILTELVCTKCGKGCLCMAELHRHMLECGGDHAWLLGLSGSNKKKCKWRPFGSRSRRRRQRGMKRNIQNSQTQPRLVTTDRPRERPTPTGPRVRPSDRESIQKMLANLPAKRATRKVLQDNVIRSQGRLRQVQTRTRLGIIDSDSSSASRISRNKTALRNKLLKNAKSIQRNRCRSDNISAIIESVVKKCHEIDKRSSIDLIKNVEDGSKKDAKEFKESTSSTIGGKTTSGLDDRTIRPRVGRPRIFGKKGNMKIKKQLQNKNTEKLQKMRSKSVKLRNVALEMKNDANNEMFSPKNTPKNAKVISKLNNDICFDSKKIVSTISGVKNKTKLTLSAPKRKRPIDPVASLNASIKAKSQLRTQDGKFARNPNKDSSTKLLDNKINNGKSKNTDLMIDDKSKLKMIQKLKKTEVQSPRRVTRLSSDSDNMPTLEPVVQIVSSNEEYTDKSVNDLPILSPVMSSSMSLQEQKISRTFTKYALKEKEGNIEMQMEKDIEKRLVKTAFVPDIPSEVKKLLFSFTDEEEDVLNTLEVISNDTGPRRSLRQSAPRLKANDENLRESDDELNNLKSISNIDFEIVSKNNLKEQKSVKVKKLKEKVKDVAKQKEDINEENRISKTNSIVLKEGRAKSKKNFSINNINNAEEISKTETVISKKDPKTKKEEAKETRSNSKIRLEKDSEKEVIKLPDIPFEVKKLLFSFTSEEEDVLSVLEVISNDSGPRRSLRQSAPKLKTNDETLQQLDDELDGLKNTSKKKKIEAFKKSFRKNINEKKNINDIIKTSSENNVANNEGQNEKNHSNKKDNRASAKEIKIDNLNIMEDKINVKGELSLEGEGDNLQKSNDISEKCRGRNRSVDRETEKTNMCAMEKQDCIANEVCNEKKTDRQIEETVDKANNKSESDDETDSNSDDRSDAAMINLNLSHLQSETSNLSIDSGKENSLETSVNVHSKLKLTRLKKTWGTRRERSSRKRSLSNVIGILTEGMNSKNIPVETQQNVQVLTVQTSLDNSDRVMCNGNAQQPTISDADNMIAVDTTFSELSSVVARNEEGSTEGEVITTMNAIANVSHRMDEKNITQPCSKTQDENVFTSQNIDMSSNVIAVKTRIPSTDIILDLSRRKPKGKGSFLEKIVSKIAKQKDALFEGEVGSLLDTAADELTSILDEVGPTLADNADNVNFDRTSYVSKDDNSENMMNISTNKETLTIADSKIQPLEDSKIIVEDIIFERTMDLETQDNVEENSILEKTKRHIQNENDVNCVLEKESLIEESHICKNKSAMKKEMAIVAPLKITNASQLSMTDISMENHNSLDLIQKTNSRDTENTKSKKKSRKRSLEDETSFKKSKKRLIKIDEEHVKDNTTPKELQFDDIIASIHESEDINKKFIQKENEAIKISNVDIGNEKIQSSLKKSVKNDLELTKSERDLEGNCNRLNLKKLAYLSKTVCNIAKKSTANTEDSIREVKIIVNASKERTDVQLKESVENVKSSLFAEKDIKHKKSMDETQTDKAIDMKELMSRRVSKRKSQHVKNTPRIFVRPIDELKEVSSLSVTGDELLKLSDEELMKVNIIDQDTEENTSLKRSLLQTTSTQYEETQKIDSSSFVDSISSKTTKKRNAKKKSLADEHLELPENEPTKIAPKSNEKSRSYMTNSNERLSVSLEHFKIPEMTNMLQNAKKRYTKKKSLSENGHWNNEGLSAEHRTSEESIEIRYRKISNLIERIEEQEETEKIAIDEQSRNRRKLERSNSSDLIGLVSSPVQTKATLKKKTQLSNDDFANSNMQFHQNAESTDDLSESSCTSECSYFRKKRFAKKKKREEKNSNITNMRTINSPIVDPEIKTDKIKSLLDEHLDLSDSDIDIPIDIQTSLENTKAFENIEREFELTEKSLNSQNKEKLLIDDSMNKNLSSTTERITSNNYDGLDDPIASKKRAADNFVVVHTKTGEILIVEKRKKLTKEMAKFFCDVCATSFTRKSSLKKHTLSQSHLSQVAKSKDKVELTDNSASTNEESKDWKNYETNNREADDVLENIQCDNLIQKSLELNKYASYVNSVDERQMTNSLVSFEVNRQETLEDKLLDEEICKITENMSHDEYVLTDQLTPEQPISSSTPINPAQEKQENSVQNKNEKKRNKLKKRNLADEHLILDSPEIEKFKVKEFPHVNNVNNVSVMSLEYSSTEKITKTVEKMKEVIKEIQSLNTVETNNQTISNLKFLNEETDSSKLSACEVDMKFEQHKESARTTRSTLRKLTKMNNEGKEENEISTEMNRFGLRPRKSKNFIQHYTESDIENYVYFIDISEELNDEMENICDMQKVQNTAKKETNEDTSQEKLDTENKDTKDRKSKPDATHDIKKRKRGRPKLKNRIIANSNIISVYEEFKIKENSSVTATAFEESKVKNQKLDMCIKEMQHTDTVVLPPKRSRGRPRKNPVQTASNSTVQADNSNVSESIKPNCNETKEKVEQIEPCSDTIIEKISSTNLITSLTLNTESLSVVEDYALESNLLETKKNPSHVEEISCIDLNTSKNQSIQEIESINIKTTDNIHAKDYNTLSLKALPEKEKDDFFLPLEINMPTKDVEYISEKKSTHDTNVNISDHLLSQITENTSIIMDNPKLIERETITPDENETHKIEIQKPVDISELSEEKQTKLEEKILIENEILEAIHKEMELSSKNENEILITDDKIIRITDSYNLLPQQKNDLENDNDEKILLESPSKKSFKSSSQFISKERDDDHKKSKTFKDKRRKVATSKISELSSDSENENRIESASSNKSKIVKSVFGRVFGCEKADKVKEVLNDWVSRSEDDSTDDVSRNASEAFCLRGSTKISENGYKKHYSSSNMKNIERSSRKKDSDKSNNIGIHGKSKNRKKQEKDSDSISEDRIKLPSLIHTTKRKSRESKIRADERILRTFDDESLIVSENENIDEIEETGSQFENDSLNEKDKESKKYQEEEWNEEQTKNKNAISKNCEDLQAKHEAHGKSKNNSSYRKRQNVNTQDEHSSSSSQFNMFKYRRRESKTKAGEKIWRTFDNKTLSYLPDERDLEKTHEMEETEFYEAREINHLNDSKHVKQTDSDTLKTLVLEENQDQAQIDSGKNRKDLSSHKKEDFDAPSNGLISIVNAFTDKHKISKKKMEKIPKDFKHTIITENIQEKNDQTQDNFESFVYDISKSINQGHNLSTKLDQPKISVKISKRDKKEDTNENWKHSTRNLKFDQKDVTEDNQLEKDRLKNKESQRNCSSSTDERLILKNISEENSQTVPGSDNDGNDKKEEEEDDDENSDNDVDKRRMSPLYARETPNSSIESSSNNEEEEEEDGEEEEEQITPEDNSRKTISNEFSGEKIIIRSPSSGHGSDVVTIAPTDAIEDNALDVPREIESTTESRQGKILNFDEELFVECCSRLKATSENELRGAKKIKLDHTESYYRKDDQSQGFKINKDRWRDVESQNSLGSLLESVNQLLGEEMYNSHDKSYRMRGSEGSSRSASPDASQVDNLGYEDSLKIAFEHNNKLRDKIQQRMRESENLIASTFNQKTNDDNQDYANDKQDSVGNSYSSSMHEHEELSTSVISNKEQESSSGHKNRMNSTLGGLLDKALSNLLHSNGKHDHNDSASMKLLAELACARAPTSMSSKDTASTDKNHQSVKMVAAAVAAAAAAAAAARNIPDSSKRSTKDPVVIPRNPSTKKARNSIKELFERKKEMNDRKEQEHSKIALIELQKQRKPKKKKRQQLQLQHDFPLIRKNERCRGLMEKKKRRDSLERKREERIKDVYDFDEEESQTALPTLGSVMSYRCQIDKNYESVWSKTKNSDGDLNSILENSKIDYIADHSKLNVTDRKLQELEKFVPKTKGALKSFQSEEQQQQPIISSITGPMDEFVERKQRLKRPMEQNVKQSNKLKKRGKSSKKRTRNAWYENDSSDEFRTAAKTEDVGVGISKSQRACSKGKQNIFADLSTSSESEYDQDDADPEIVNEQRISQPRKCSKKAIDIDININERDRDQYMINEHEYKNEEQIMNDWQDQVTQENTTKKNCDVAKSESEMSNYSLIIDERKIMNEAKNSDDEMDNQYERTFELDDLYRADSSDAETETEENEENKESTPIKEEMKNSVNMQVINENASLQTEATPINAKNDHIPENELISLEEALNFLDRDEDLDQKSENVHGKIQTENNINNITEMDEISNDEIENKVYKSEKMRNEKKELDDVSVLPEKLSSNEKPQKESDNNLPLHVFLNRKVQESKKRKQQQLDKLREEQKRILMDFQPTRRQRKCAIGKQGLLAEISSSDEELDTRDNNRRGNDHDKSRKKRESKEKKKERYLEKKHEQIIAKEQKAIEEEILREVGKRKEILAQNVDEIAALNDVTETKVLGQVQKKKHQTKEKQKRNVVENIEENTKRANCQFSVISTKIDNDKPECVFSIENAIENNGHLSTSTKQKKCSKSPARSRKSENGKISANKKNKDVIAEKSKKTSVNCKDSKERRLSSGKRDSDDEELKTTKSWNKVEEGVGVAIGRRKRSAAHQLYYWSSSSDEEEIPEPVVVPEEEEDRQEQHGWIVGDSHKRMITMLAMEKQLKEKRRRSEDEFEPGKSKNKKHRNSTS